MPLGQVKATVLVENTSDRADLEAEHGFSVWIETGESKVLFDTGASGLLCRNAEVLGIDLAQADAVVLSHGHYDHTGGLADVMKLARNARIHAHPAAGIDCSGRCVMLSRASEIVVPGIRTTGEVARV
ncbi:MAG: MBL fold metallo-hydrolase, partial [Planctomycetota bacterium]